jgi:hypothetical protein
VVELARLAPDTRGELLQRELGVHQDSEHSVYASAIGSEIDVVKSGMGNFVNKTRLRLVSIPKACSHNTVSFVRVPKVSYIVLARREVIEVPYRLKEEEQEEEKEDFSYSTIL